MSLRFRGVLWARIRPVDVTATLDLAGAPITVTGVVDRASAEVGAGQTGREIFARIDPDDARVLRPGDFMRVDIAEPRLEGVAVIPATATTSDPVREGAVIEDKKMVAITDEERERFTKRIESNAYIPKDAKARILKQLQEDEIPEDMYARMGGEGRGQGSGRPANGQSETASAGGSIALDDDRRAKLIAFVEGNKRMPADAKTRVLEQLKADEVPAEMVERIESRMGS